MFKTTGIKFNQLVWHDQPYLHPVQRIDVGADFYDRLAEKTLLKTHLQAKTCTPLIIIGERRSGKTSLLKLLDDYMLTRSSVRFIPVCNIWAGFKPCRDLILEIWQGIRLQLRKILRQNLPQTELKPSTTPELLQALRNLPLTGNQKLVIAIDELDSYINEAEEIAPPEIPLFEELVQQLIAASDLPLQLLLTVTHIPPTLITKIPTRTMVSVRLHPFNQIDLTEMVKGIAGPAAITLVDDDLSRLFQLSGGWPWWVKLLLLCLNETTPGENWLTYAADLAIKHPNVGPMIENVYFYHFDQAEKMMVLTLAKHHGCLNADQIPAMPLSRQTALANLVERDYVQQNSEGDYKFKIGLMADWFLTWNRFDEEMGLYSG